MNIVITGGNGFIGKNLETRISEYKKFKLIKISYKLTSEEIYQKIKKCDFIIHLAGVNRPQNIDDFYTGNVQVTKNICEANLKLFKKSGKKIPIIFSSSIHSTLDNEYGKSKAAAEKLLIDLNKEYKIPIFILRLPNVFGKWCKPNYNSFVSTILFNTARDISIDDIDEKNSLKLLYIDDLIELIIKILEGGKVKIIRKTEVFIEKVYSSKLGDIVTTINKFKESNNTLILDGVGEGLCRALYSTYLSYLPKNKFEYQLNSHKDDRGLFVEFFKTTQSGQFSFFTAYPNVTRGEHYHNSKNEKFLVCQGHARFDYKNLENGEIHTIFSRADQFKVINSIPGWAHSITNIGEENLIVLLWANELFEKRNPDTYPYEIK